MPPSPDLLLTTDRLLLSLPPPAEAARVAGYYQRNRAHHGPWDPPRTPAFFGAGFWKQRLRDNRRDFAAGQSLRLFLCARDAPQGPILGSVNFTSLVRGPFQGCRLGYSLDQEAVGRGIMTEALQVATRYVFDALELHRIEANYVPTNARSGAVLRRLGFVIDGYARDYLFIAGAWRDHVLTSLTTPHPAPPPA